MRKHGTIEVVTGPMFCGKTRELLRRLNRSVIAKQIVQLFKPSIDNRYTNKAKVVSHQKEDFDCICVSGVDEMEKSLLEDVSVIGIDEVQFMNVTVVSFVEKMANKGKRIILAGLDQDYTGEPFGVMPFLLARADCVLKLDAICVICGEKATKTFRKTKDDSQVVIGEKDIYEARCRSCWLKG